MRVLHVLDSLDPAYGGPVKAVRDLSIAARAHGIESEFAGFCNSPVLHTASDIHLFQVTAPRRYRYAPSFQPWLRQNLSRFDGLILHSSWLHWAWAASKECVRSGIPYAYFPHGMLETWSVRAQGWGKRLKKELYWHWRERTIVASSRCMLFTTRREQRLTEQTFDLPAVPLRLIPYGAAPPTGPVTSVAPRGLEDLCPKKYVLFLGRIHPKKNPDLLLRAWMRAGPSDWELVIAGPSTGKYGTSLRQMSEGPMRGTRVRFLDFVDGPAKTWLLSNAGWFALPSSQENFGVAVIEALRHECPVALSDQVALAEEMPALTPVLPTSVEAWQRFLSRVGEDAYRQQVRSVQLDFLHERFDMSTLASGWAATLKMVLQ